MRSSDRAANIDAHLHRPWAERQRPAPPTCAWPGCPAEGRYRAPRSRERLRDYVFFCLEHVREYNRRWDYFLGMSAEEIERHRRDDVTWHRPTWRFGTGPGFRAPPEFDDPLGLFREQSRRRDPTDGDRTARQMRERLGLGPGFTLAELKRRFKELAKRYHPDLNDGDRSAEARLREVIEAYRYLLAHRSWS
ncbi:MAG: DnaJ domain-containing protein [Geminicoccaceae bacterium]|nr:DnaJ domain-containing protein [Geminicoccaceae bacterium]MCS7267849.1 DnaJ domain-containing protein [Geminicoccaceae bacterium]MCX7630014.1 DnaJ domain-containing protein [Geminicoccaceae bacterium]MDW8124528.1 DnaJ domain-containing protein [Geminicoccaceae bacterium]MDW8341344.1 DnaJ domain-containing protein [Geminicoccaceae bacterium]